MTAPSLPPETRPRGVAGMNRAFGILFTALGLLLLVAWWTGRAGDRHGMGFAVIGAAWLGPAGPLFLLAEHAWRRGWRGRWLVQALPILYPAVFIAVLTLTFG